MGRCLVIVAKEPKPNQVKTRLGDQIGYTRAAELYRCFLRDTIQLVSELPQVTGAISCWPPDAQATLAALAPSDFYTIAQQGRDLGERLLSTFEAAYERRYTSVVVMSSDSPSVPIQAVRAAFESLDDPQIDAVLGPCSDGGYYLIGMRQPLPCLFHGITWSTDAVTAQTQAAAAESHLNLRLVPMWYDIDTLADLVRLTADLRLRRAAGGQHSYSLEYIERHNLLPMRRHAAQYGNYPRPQ